MGEPRKLKRGGRCTRSNLEDYKDAKSDEHRGRGHYGDKSVHVRAGWISRARIP